MLKVETLFSGIGAPETERMAELPLLTATTPTGITERLGESK